ncbi:MAG TPA: hypothetical protein VLU73_18075, partial [Methylococcaceae bacterium]|nr:hypothetical protein [Methylococcaceae bacterium]
VSFLLVPFLWTSKEKEPARGCGNPHSNKPSRSDSLFDYSVNVRLNRLLNPSAERVCRIVRPTARQVKHRDDLSIGLLSVNMILSIIPVRDDDFRPDSGKKEVKGSRQPLPAGKVRGLFRRCGIQIGFQALDGIGCCNDAFKDSPSITERVPTLLVWPERSQASLLTICVEPLRLEKPIAGTPKLPKVGSERCGWIEADNESVATKGGTLANERTQIGWPTNETKKL